MGQSWAKRSGRKPSPPPRGRRNSHGEDSSYFLGWQEYDRNPYDPITNSQGIIQMGLAENQLSFDLMEEWLAANPHASGFQDKKGGSVFRDLALFQDYHGLPDFKQAFARFMAELRGNKVSFSPDCLVLTAGATSANEILVFCLAEPGDAILLPTPYYPGFDRDLKWRTGVDIVPVDCDSANGYRLTRTALEDAYSRARAMKKKVKGVLITNPSNPLGTAAKRDELYNLLGFLDAHRGLHLISDEIYAGTVFDESGFVSIKEAVKDYARCSSSSLSRRVHIVSSLSKDLGLPGFRVGAIYSEDPAIVSTATKMSSFGLISSQTQHLLAAMLSDQAFTTRYSSENRRRLRLRHDALVSGFLDAGVPCLPSDAGLFCWVDMRHLLDENTFQGEMRLWKRILYDVGLNVSPGESCHCTEPGWFRVCFANVSEETLLLAIRRLKDFITEYQRTHQRDNQNKVMQQQQRTKSNSKSSVVAKKVWPLLSLTVMPQTPNTI